MVWGEGRVIKTIPLAFKTFSGSQDNLRQEPHGKGLQTGVCVPSGWGAGVPHVLVASVDRRRAGSSPLLNVTMALEPVTIDPN